MDIRKLVSGYLVGVASSLPSESYANGSFVTYRVMDREVDAFVPTCARPDSPLIVSLHAWATGRVMQENVDRYSRYVGPECAVLVYPQGKARGMLFGMVGFAWNAGGCCANGNTQHIDDVGFVQEVITNAITRFHISEEMVFVSGISNGGMLANRLACTDSRIKAFVAVSGPLVNGTGGLTEPFDCSRKVPMLHFHGVSDPIVPFHGCNSTTGPWVCKGFEKLEPGATAAIPSVAEYIDGWRARNGVLRNTPKASFTNGTCSCQTWGDDASNNVTLCALAYEGHAWPGVCPELGRLVPWLNCSLDVDASAQAMNFFRQYMPKATITV